MDKKIKWGDIHDYRILLLLWVDNNVQRSRRPTG